MASSLFGNSSPIGTNNSIFNRLNSIKDLVNGNPQGVYNNLMQSNPQFAEFVRQNQGKSPEQIAQENGIDMNAIKSFMQR